MKDQEKEKCTREMFDTLVKYNASVEQAEDIIENLVIAIHKNSKINPLTC